MPSRLLPARLSMRLAAAALVALTLAPGAVLAQRQRASSPFQGFSSDSGKPVNINADSLEVRQNENKAIFTGNVVATQGESTLRSSALTVFYTAPAGSEGKGKQAEGGQGSGGQASGSQSSGTQATPASEPTGQGAAPVGGAPGQPSGIRRLEASGGVVVTSSDQKATGQTGIFDLASNTATLTGGVVLSQGPNVIRGRQLVVDLKSGVARVVGGTSGLFVPSSQRGGQ